MGSAVSSVMGSIGGGIGSVANPVAGTVGGVAGGALGNLAQGIISAIPDIPIADQSQVQGQIQGLNNLATQNSNNAGDQLAASNQSLGNTQQAIGQSQGAINQAQNVNTGAGSNVNNAIGLTAQTAAGGGPAQQAARAQLQAGTDQAIHTQQAMANSGNLSQMIGGQKTAMDNAANLQQQNANQASALQAGMSATAQQNYTGAAGQQAGQAAQNAGIQQQQAAQQANLFGTQLGAAQGYAGQAIGADQAALTGQTNALGIQQQALGQTGQNKAMAVGGVLNAAGGAAGALVSDENLKTDIQPAGSDPEDDQSQPEKQKQSQKPDLASALGNSFHIPGGQAPGQWNIIQSDANSKMDIQSADENPFSAISKGFAGSSENSNVQEKEPTPKQQSEPMTDKSAKVAKSIKDSFVQSDEHSKSDIHKDNKVSAFLDAIDPVSFKYKEADGQMGKTPGEHLGVIAQQVEKAPGGASMVVDTPKGKGIDLASAVGTLLAAASENHNRIQELEDLFKSKMEKRKK